MTKTQLNPVNQRRHFPCFEVLLFAAVLENWSKFAVKKVNTADLWSRKSNSTVALNSSRASRAALTLWSITNNNNRLDTSNSWNITFIREIRSHVCMYLFKMLVHPKMKTFVIIYSLSSFHVVPNLFCSFEECSFVAGSHWLPWYFFSILCKSMATCQRSKEYLKTIPE